MHAPRENLQGARTAYVACLEVAAAVCRQAVRRSAMRCNIAANQHGQERSHARQARRVGLASRRRVIGIIRCGAEARKPAGDAQRGRQRCSLDGAGGCVSGIRRLGIMQRRCGRHHAGAARNGNTRRPNKCTSAKVLCAQTLVLRCSQQGARITTTDASSASAQRQAATQPRHHGAAPPLDRAASGCARGLAAEPTRPR